VGIQVDEDVAEVGLPSTGLPIVNYYSIADEDEGTPSLLGVDSLLRSGAFPEREFLQDMLLDSPTLLEGAEAGDEDEPLGAILPHIELMLREQTLHPDVLVAPRDKWTARFQSFVAAKALAEGSEALLRDGVVKFSRYHDSVAWVAAFCRAKVQQFWKKTHPFLPPPARPETSANDLRIALFSDWGTGMYGAPHIKSAIELDKGGFDYVIHLGDTYYTGEEDEIERSLIRGWPRVGGAVNRALNGNHEMYSGGHAYFKRALPALDQSSSVFAFQNDHWLIVGLDTAYKDWDLGQGQDRWLVDLVSVAGDRRLILLTHHQPFSNTKQEQGPRLQARLKPLLDAKRIFAWYWGHEHVCAIYDAHPTWGLYGRCLGNGGMPEPRPWYRDLPAQKVTEGVSFYAIKGAGTNPNSVGLDGPNPYVTGHAGDYTANGFVTLEISGRRLTETYRTADGVPLEKLVFK
jgi:hypothetical protein